MGKIAVLKSLVVSQLVYVLSPLPLNVKAIKEVNKLFFAFLWNGKGDTIKRNTIINDYPNGVLKMIDIVFLTKASEQHKGRLLVVVSFFRLFPTRFVSY